MPFFFDNYPYTNFHNVNLDWVLQEVKAWGQTVDANNRAFQDLKEANEDFKEYVTSYLQDLDITDEINTKLDAMLASGVLTPYFAPYVQGYVNSWLNSHVTPTSPALDNTLSLSSAAARADAVGSRLKDLAYIDALSTPEVYAAINRSQVMPGYRVQGITYDYDGHFYVCGGSVDEDGTGAIVKMTSPDFKDAEMTVIQQLGHANDITYYDGYLYVCTVGGGDAPQWGIYKINVNDFTDKTLISNAPENTIGITYRRGDFWLLAPYRIYRTTDFTNYEVIVDNTNNLMTAYGIPTSGRLSQTIFRAAGYLIGWVCSFVFEERHYGALTFFSSTGQPVAFKMFPAYHSELQGAVYADMSIWLLADGKLVNVFRMDPRHLSYIQLKAGDDLNDFTGRGTLYSTGSNVSAELLNSPSAGEGFTVQVERLGVYNTIQTARTNSGRELYRVKSFSAGTWGEWIEPAAEVAQIKEDLSSISKRILLENLIDTDNIVNGSIVLSNRGTFSSDSSGMASRTGFIDITACEKIVYSRRTVLIPTSNTGIAFYDSAKKYISGISDMTEQSERSYIIHEAPRPLNAKYVVMTLWSNNIPNAYLYDAKNYDSIDIIAKYVGERKNFHAESLKSLPILNSFSDITIDTASYSSCEAFHNAMNTICTASNGYITRKLLGDDGHGNSIYKYETNPKRLRYAVDRGNYAPTYPINGGKWIEPFTVLLTANIHGRERNGNWVIYNLLNKLLAPDSEMLRFFHDRVRFVCIPYICASGNYSNSDGVNINRDFPVSYDGTCTSNEATFVKSVIDEYGKQLMLHLDIHTFSAGSEEDHNTAGWIFTDSGELGKRCVITAEYVLEKYASKYPTITRLSEDYIGSTNIETTCTYYTQTVYDVPSATVEAVLTMDGSPEGADRHTSATAYFYDIITQTICSMI